MHYPVDSAAGAILGITLGEYIAARATGQGETPSRSFDGSGYAPEPATSGTKGHPSPGGDFHIKALADLLTTGRTDLTGQVMPDSGTKPIVTPGQGRHTAELWRLAIEEVRLQWGLPPMYEGPEYG